MSSEATMEMLQPTREMYVRGASSSAGTGAWESCCGREGGPEAWKCPPLPKSKTPAKTSASSPPYPTILAVVLT